jgi:hemerythrin-like domain-containing protein
LEQRIVGLEHRVEDLERKTDEHSKIIAKFEVYTEQILKGFEKWESKLFDLFSAQSVTTDKSNDRWFEALKELIKLTIYIVGAVIGAKIITGG